MTDVSDRHPIKTRATAWAQSFASELARGGVSPDLISALGLAFAVVGFGALAISGLSEGAARVVWLGLGLICIQLRLIANMLDGMVAVEHRKASRIGPIWNELSVPVSDTLFFIGAGYGAVLAGPNLGPAFGWLCAVLAAVTAYVRLLGRSLGQAPDYTGPAGKIGRMALLSAVVLVSMLEGLWGWSGETLLWGLAVIAALTALTAFRRTRTLARALKAKG